jgi:hypothetical protein
LSRTPPFVLVQESAETLGQALCQGKQVQAGLPQRVQEREDRSQPRTQRQRRHHTLTGPGEQSFDLGKLIKSFDPGQVITVSCDQSVDPCLVIPSFGLGHAISVSV